MTDLVIVGTDTDAGKTTVSLLWLSVFAETFDYWKPVETGDSDSERVRSLVPGITVHPPLGRFADPVAPPLAARREGAEIPSARTIAGQRPASVPGRHLLIETFGSPFSPLNETELQLSLLKELALPLVLVSPSSVGAIGRVLQCQQALCGHGLPPAAVILVGAPDPYAQAEIQKHTSLPVVGVEPPRTWDAAGVKQASDQARESLQRVLVEKSMIPSRLSPTEMDELLERDQRFVWHPFTPLRGSDPPLVCLRAQDEFLYLADGRRVIDGFSSWWTILHGHRHPPLMSALAEAMQSFDHVHFAGVTHPAAVELAELLLVSAHMSDGRVFYSDDGSTAVEVALKLAYQFWCHLGEPQRTLFVGFEHGYHGDTFGAMAVGRDPLFFQTFEPLLFRTASVPVSAQRLDEFLTQRGSEVAGVILEPLVQGAGGMLMHSPKELQQIVEVIRRHNVLFIADEVMTGGGRTGTLWAHQAALPESFQPGEQSPLLPDLMSAGKTLAGGILPLAATLASARITAAFDTEDRKRTFFHGHSFTAHPLACAIAAVNWRALASQPHPTPRRMEAYWLEHLAPLRDHPRVREVRIRGTIAAIELEVEGGYLATEGRKMRLRCLEEGVVLRPLGNVLYTLPPLCTSDASLEQIVRAMRVGVGV